MKTIQHSQNVFPLPVKQKGIVLIMVLTLLLALTILGVSSMSTSTLETRMANNFQERGIAFQAAEAALREGERLVETSNFNGSEFNNLCTNGLCECNKATTCDYNSDSTQTFWELNTVWNTSGKYKTYQTSNLGITNPAKYIIEHMGNVCPDTNPSCAATATDPRMFRITALGYGKTVTAKVMLQSTYKK